MIESLLTQRVLCPILLVMPSKNQISLYLSKNSPTIIHLRDMIVLNRSVEMSKTITGVLFALVMIAVVVCMDLLFFRNQFWERLMANVGVVLLFIAFYLRFLK